MDSDRLFYSRLFLATFIKPRPLDKVPPVPDFLDKPDWNTALGERVENISTKFINEKLIITADTKAHLHYKYKNAEDVLQGKLKALGLPVSGTLDDMIASYLKTENAASEKFEGVDVVYQLSANGEEIVREGIRSSHWFRMMVSAVITGIIGNRADSVLVESFRSLLKEFQGDRTSDEGDSESLPKQYIERLPGGVKLEMVLIPGGSFMMGSKRFDNEQPFHKVRLKPFYMGKYQVTQAEWKAVMKRNPSQFMGDDLPVENVTWDEVQEFCKKLSRNTDRAYRLPSEAEWEYAARAGSEGDFCFGDDESLLGDYAWYGESNGQTHPVGSKKPNKWGLYDVHGNVLEWCEDGYHGNYDRAPDDGKPWESSVLAAARVVRGGSWRLNAVYCRSAYRDWNTPGVRYNGVGFRLSRTLHSALLP